MCDERTNTQHFCQDGVIVWRQEQPCGAHVDPCVEHRRPRCQGELDCVWANNACTQYVVATEEPNDVIITTSGSPTIRPTNSPTDGQPAGNCGGYNKVPCRRNSPACAWMEATEQCIDNTCLGARRRQCDGDCVWKTPLVECEGRGEERVCQPTPTEGANAAGCYPRDECDAVTRSTDCKRFGNCNYYRHMDPACQDAEAEMTCDGARRADCRRAPNCGIQTYATTGNTRKSCYPNDWLPPPPDCSQGTQRNCAKEFINHNGDRVTGRHGKRKCVWRNEECVVVDPDTYAQ